MKNTILTTGLLAILLCVTSLSTYAHKRDKHIVNGWNVTKVVYSSSGQPMGRFVKTGRKQWTEYSKHNNLTFHFVEQQRDEWSVYLYDASRDVYIQLDLHRKKVGYRRGNETKRDIYNIIRSKSKGKKNKHHHHEHQINLPPEPVVSTPINPAPISGESVSYINEHELQVFLEKKGPTRWIEYSVYSDKIHQYVETQRYDNMIYLHDASRNLSAVIKFKENIIVYTKDRGPDPKYYYPLNKAQQLPHNTIKRYQNHSERKSFYNKSATGLNVTRVVFGEDNIEQGEFIKVGANTWIQSMKHEKVTLHFVVKHAGSNSIYMYNKHQDLHVEIDFISKKITYGERHKLLFDAYDIMRSEH